MPAAYEMQNMKEMERLVEQERSEDVVLHFLPTINEGDSTTAEDFPMQQVARNRATPTEAVERNALLYGIDERPSWPLCALLGLQHYIIMAGSTISVPLLLAPRLCIVDDDAARALLISTVFFVNGLSTLLQCTLGCRLPIVQGTSFSFLLPTFAILSLEQYRCPSAQLLGNITDDERTDLWQSRLLAVQGAIALSSLVQIAIGFSGSAGFIMRYVGPLTIAPTITIIGLSLFQVAADQAGLYWPCALLTIALLTLFSQYMAHVRIATLPIFRLFAVLLAVGLAWLVFAGLTFTGLLADSAEEGASFYARVDTRSALLANSPWLRVPYPLQWGVPTMSASLAMAMLAGVLVGIVESIGDYYACARLAGAPPPPAHAINRGIGMEGVACLVAGIFGSGSGSTSYSENIAAIGLTRVGSRAVVQASACVMLLVGVVVKLSAVFASLPDPLVAGLFFIMFGMVASVGLSNLQHVDLRSSRNLFVLGVSLIAGLVVPTSMRANEDLMLTRFDAVNRLLYVLGTTEMFVCGAIALFLDNTISGSDEERGLLGSDAVGGGGGGASAYDLPFGISAWCRQRKWTRRIPTSPSFGDVDSEETSNLA